MDVVEPRTANGRATRARILDAATALIAERGVAWVSLDDVRERSGTSKSQLYLYFEGREALLRAVVGRTAEAIMAVQERHFAGGLDDLSRIAAWFDDLVALQTRRQARGGCPLGSLAGQIAEHDEGARVALARSFDAWQRPLESGLRAMRERGELRLDADPATLAAATMAALQGGLLLTQVRRDPGQLRLALDAALGHLRGARA
jgi:TetR/AcrR family transcriptional repressor of nem operon